MPHLSRFLAYAGVVAVLCLTVYMTADGCRHGMQREAAEIGRRGI